MDKNRTTTTVKTPAQNFTGDVWMNPVFAGDGTSRLTVGLVRFTPGARTNWHRQRGSNRSPTSSTPRPTPRRRSDR